MTNVPRPRRTARSLGRRSTVEAIDTPPGSEVKPSDRPESSRLQLSLDIAVPVLVRSDDGLARGLARNISERGMLVEIEGFPPIGSPVDVTISGVSGSTDAPDALTLKGEVRHHLAWQYAGERRAVRVLRGIGIRFSRSEIEIGDATHASEQPFRWALGETIH